MPSGRLSNSWSLEPRRLRNPTIVAAFRRIGLSDQAGTGIRAIFKNWRQLGNVLPRVVDHKADKSFELTLVREQLVSDSQRRFQKELGVSLDEHEASLLAYACKQDQISLSEAKAVTGLSGANAKHALDALVINVLLKPLRPGVLYTLAEQIRDCYAQSEKTVDSGPAAGQESRPESRLGSGQESDMGTRILTALKAKPLSRRETAQSLGHSTVSGAGTWPLHD